MRRTWLIAVLAVLCSADAKAANEMTGRIVWRFPQVRAAVPLADGGVAALATSKDKEAVIWRVDQDGKSVWGRLWPEGEALRQRARLALADRFISLADGSGSFASIPLDDGTLISMPLSATSDGPGAFFPDGGVARNCSFFDGRQVAVPCADRLRHDGTRLWLWQDRAADGDQFIHGLTPRADGGLLLFLSSRSPAETALFPNKPETQRLVCLDGSGGQVAALSIKEPLRFLDMATTSGGQVLLAGWIGKPQPKLRLMAFDGRSCQVLVTQDSDLSAVAGSGEPSFARLLVSDFGWAYLAGGRGDGSGDFLASVEADGALHAIGLKGFRGDAPSLSADGKRLVTVVAEGVLEFRLSEGAPK